MATIKLTPEDLRTSAVKYSNGAEDIRTVLNSLMTGQETIRSNREGSAFASFDHQFTELSPKINEFAQLLNDINAQLNKVVDIIEQTDQDIVTQIGG
ncbi:WXG100 family type VII secretion target [Streptococcus ovuberis]|uniref:ESAT-6-like protein n=1 Tax=Streptococcus ovuberis TaxID=1936207 RepID=A0A7X6N0P1_9STRE|nr:WXG100 family type VII secretion target [Streptococcus ovuberis]NKZ21338.1 WXG100 family type VII secretion target [Streptococcus ovuberis]